MFTNLILIVGYVLVLFYSVSNLVVGLTIFRVKNINADTNDIETYWNNDDYIQLFGLGVGYFDENHENLLYTKQSAKMTIYLIIFFLTYSILIVTIIVDTHKTLLLNQTVESFVRFLLLFISIVVPIWAITTSNKIFKYIKKSLR